MKELGVLLLGAIWAGLACQGCQGSSPVLGSVHRTTGAVSAGTPAAMGSPCLPEDELQEYFPGSGVAEIAVETDSAACESRVCLVNHMQGRASCPYGQTAEQALHAPACFVPGTDEPVKVEVRPQFTGRQAGVVSTCSCRCAGPGPGPFCECPGGMECVPLIQANPVLGSTDLAGSYCIAAGTTYDPAIETPVCQNPPTDCGDPRPY